MVKGISKQVILLQSPDKELFEQAIFILRDDAVGRNAVTDDLLLREAKRLVCSQGQRDGRKWFHCALWALSGAAVTGITWLITFLI